MKRLQAREIDWKFSVVAGFLIWGAGCAADMRPQTITEDQFVALYKDQTNITDVYYMGSDDTSDYFCMEHWKDIKPDGSDGVMDRREFFKVAMSDIHTRQPFPYTADQSKWRLMRPKPG